MDVAVGIVRMAGVGTKLSTALMFYAGGVADADKNMTAIAGDVALTSNVLASVGHFLKERENSSMATPSALMDAQAILTRCHNTFEEIKGILDKTAKTDESGARKTSKRARLIWPVKSNKAELLTSRLESLKSSLMLLLQVLSFAKDWTTGNFGPQSVTERCDSIRDLHRREQEALAAESDLEKRMGAASLRSPASRNDHTLLQSFDKSSWALPRSTNMDYEQKTRPSNEQADLFQNLHVDSKAQIPALRQTERGRNNEEDQTFDASTRTLPRTTDLPSKAVQSSGDVASKNRECLQQLETLKQETQLLLTSIQQTQDEFFRGSLLAEEARCFLDSRYETFFHNANFALKMPWIQQTWLPPASFQQPQLNSDLIGIGTGMRPQDSRRRCVQLSRGPSHSPLSDYCMAETAAQGQQGGPQPPEPLISYQEHLLSLERQNKHRLLFAHQEQEGLEHHAPMPSPPVAVMSTTESQEAWSAFNSAQQPCQEATRLTYQDKQQPTAKDNDFALDFAVEGLDELENFDFDSFFHNTDDNNGLDDFDFTIDFNESQSKEREDESESATKSHSETMDGEVSDTPSPPPLQTARNPLSLHIHDKASWINKEDIVTQLLKRWTNMSIPVF
ncbi:phosphorus acquisition-controlling protein [Venturia nashicola]|uniref:Phosphorus acquisition-controlling protein n=1 Tax=Venturia nashicola TaxID=86259 RepID=A0A4Z1PVL1_9PEZI|nr:phosphorus acquisition-controlling protein [Venturia nashicola]